MGRPAARPGAPDRTGYDDAMEPGPIAAPPGRPRRGPARGGTQIIPWPPDFRAGERAPWAHLRPGDRHVDIEDLRRAFRRRRPRPPVREPFAVRRPAAVLLPLYTGGDGLRVVLTRRPTAMRSHSGEVSFPGGGFEATDADLVATALRESEEEIALPADRVEIIGQLDPLATLSSAAMITPYVGYVADLPALRPEPREVAAILHVPVAELLEDGVFHQEWWPLPPQVVDVEAGAAAWRPMFFYELTGDTVWGATARLLTQLLGIATGTEAG
ncbi:MAG: NUDIX domain-containing protein [Acidimicrobiia bacterium]|nr:NUDIX domain-containing protein [Acidimicrobiia bacterium]